MNLRTDSSLHEISLKHFSFSWTFLQSKSQRGKEEIVKLKCLAVKTIIAVKENFK